MNLTATIATTLAFATAFSLAAEFRVGFASADITPPEVRFHLRRWLRG